MIHANFTPGPSQLYFTVSDHARRAFRDGIPSISHRSRAFEKIFRDTTEKLKQLLGLPDDFRIVFTGSATEIWERIIQNLVEHSSYHFVNGSFSKRFYETAIQLKRHALKEEVAEGTGFEICRSPDGSELIAITQNETSSGVSLTNAFIASARENRDALIAVDAVSSLPYPSFDYRHIDTVFFSVQKGFGLPAGLGVWIVNSRCIEKASHLMAKDIPIGSYHSLPSLLASAEKNQTPETPNVLGIYLLEKVIDDFLRRGIDAIRKETDYKAAVLYQALERHPLISPFVRDLKHRSATVIVADTGVYTESLARYLGEKGLSPGDGYGPYKKSQLRFANFPAHSREQYELLADSILSFEG